MGLGNMVGMWRSAGFFRWMRLVLLGPAYFYHKLLISISRKQNYNLDVCIEPQQRVLLTKDMIRANPNKYLRKSVFVPLIKCRTGGTTGTPFVFYLDRFWARQKERAYIFDIWDRIGYHPFDYRIVVRGNGNHGVRYSWFENALMIPQNYFVEENREELLRIFQARKYFLHVYPSVLNVLVDFFGDSTFASFPVAGIFAGSESFPVHQIEYFEKKFGFKIAHWYGHSEYAVLARHCPKCKEFHFYPTYGTVSLVGSGTEKMIVATSKNRYGTLFRNYVTEDYATVSECTCDEDSYPKVHAIIGRTQEFMLTKDMRRIAFGPYLFGIHTDFWEMVSSIQFVQNEPGILQVRYVPSVSFRQQDFESFLSERFSIMNLVFEKNVMIERTRSGKHRYFVQNVVD